MRVLVNGIGNIGSTLCQLLLRYKAPLQIHEIYAHKRKIQPWNQAEIDLLKHQGVVVVETDQFENILPTLDYIFEATPNGTGLKHLLRYQRLEKLKGASAQGSEKGFGIPFISEVNNDAITDQKFVQVVSCNTHGTSAILQLFGGKKLENIDKADVVVVRRSEDISNHERLVSGNVVARHLHPEIGTHHAIDVLDVYKTLGIFCRLTSSDITTPSQFLHAVRFNITLKKPLENKLIDKIQTQPYLGITNKFDSNVIFEMGRRYGVFGRLFNHAILVNSNIMVNENNVQGWAFVPQEGNTLISTLHAFVLQMNLPEPTEIIQKIRKELLLQEL